jgi:peptidoglycan/xylan/chitin deacetylase (PgdA/CDA1 family)
MLVRCPPVRALVIACWLVPYAAHAQVDIPARGPEVLFTFDDGPAHGKTEKVLDLLDQHHIKAVFFVNGWHFQGDRPEAERERALLRETLRRGHAVGNHTVHHYFLCGKVYSKRAEQEITENAALIEKAIGTRPVLFRTPYGARCKSITETLKRLGIEPVGWDIDPQDWRLRDANKITKSVTRHLKRLQGRSILLLHDVQAATVRALPKILDWLEKENASRKAHGQLPIKVIDYKYLTDRVTPS